MKSLFRFAALLLALGWGATARGQVVSLFPAFASIDDNITLTYDATQGNGALAGIQDTIYGHFGLIVGGPNDVTWTRVVGTWGTRDSRTRMTRVSPGSNLWQITFTPRNYYANTASVTGYRLSMVFRNAAGTTVGRTETGGDIFVDLYQPGQNYVRFSNPSSSSLLLQPGQTQRLLVESSSATRLSIQDNGTEIASANNGLSLTYDWSTTVAGPHVLRAVADFGGQSKADTVNILVVPAARIEPIPAGMKDGPNYPTPTSAVLVLVAPGKKKVFVRGDFNNWQYDTAYYMRRTPDSTRFWLQINNLEAGREYTYQYTIDGNVNIGDPLTEKTSDPSDNSISPLIYPGLAAYPSSKASGIASVLQPGRAPYVWRHPRPAPVPKERLVIYELLLRDFLGRAQDKSYQGLIDTLAYLQKLGVNAIELMPVSEFENNNSWGYNVIFHGAPDKAYGPQDKLKALIDSAHGRGMQVILDVVYNQAFGQSPLVNMYPLASSPYFNAVATHPYSVGIDFNHESPYTRAYIDRCNERWLADYNVDGFRFDLSKGFTQRNSGGDVGLWGQLDRSRIRNLARLYTACKSVHPSATLILEHFADNSEEKILSDSVGFMLWGNLSGSAQNAIKGTSGSDFYGLYAGSSGWTQSNRVGFYESHDEERNMYAAITGGLVNGSYSTRDIPTALNRAKAMAVLFMCVPGPKMLWEFQELGYDFSINRCGNGTINGNCRTDAKPVRWDYLQDPNRRNLMKVYQTMMRLRATEPVFMSRSNPVFVLNGTLQKRITLRTTGQTVIAVTNLGTASATYVAGFSAGRWYEFFSGDSIDVTTGNQTVTLAPGEVRLYSTRRMAAPEPNLLVTGLERALPASKGFRALPNPTESRITLEGPAGDLDCKLISAAGRQVGTFHLSTAEREIDLASLPGGKPAPGMYLLQVRSGSGPAAHVRLVVE